LADCGAGRPAGPAAGPGRAHAPAHGPPPFIFPQIAARAGTLYPEIARLYRANGGAKPFAIARRAGLC
jgi:hypothetical protein